MTNGIAVAVPFSLCRAKQKLFVNICANKHNFAKMMDKNREKVTKQATFIKTKLTFMRKEKLLDDIIIPFKLSHKFMQYKLKIEKCWLYFVDMA